MCCLVVSVVWLPLGRVSFLKWVSADVSTSCLFATGLVSNIKGVLVLAVCSARKWCAG